MAVITATPCQVCGHDDLRPLYTVSDKNQGVPGTWAIIACTACGLGRLDPMPDAATVATFYQDVFYAEDGARFRPWVEDLRRGLSGLRGLRLRRMLPAGSRLLDFGAGSGHFAESMRMRGWDAVAHDPFNSTAPAGTNADDGGPVDRTALAYSDGHFDAITLWYVIEHLLDPRDALREFHRVLRPGGILVLSQQDFSSVQARVFTSRWLFLDPPRHLFQFTPATLGTMAAQEGFTVRHVSSASLESGPFTILQSLLNCVVGNENYLFRFLKSRQLGGAGTPGGIGAVAGLGASVLLLPLIAPLSLVLYFVLLGFKSGDVFTMYLERTDATIPGTRS